MSAKKKKQANSPLRIVIILILLGLLAYKYQLFDGKLLEISPLSKTMKKNPKYVSRLSMAVHWKSRRCNRAQADRY